MLDFVAMRRLCCYAWTLLDFVAMQLNGINNTPTCVRNETNKLRLDGSLNYANVK